MVSVESNLLISGALQDGGLGRTSTESPKSGLLKG